MVSALRQRAEEHNAAAGSGAGPVSWSVEADEGVEPLPAAVEVAAYRIVIEAVTNAVRHSRPPGPARCAVTPTRAPDRGHGRRRGVGRGPVQGVGLGSIRERAEELGGTYTLSSAGSGTVVSVRLPLDAREEVTVDRLRVMVVDDHENFRRGLEAMLAATDSLEVVGTATDGRTAVELALELQPDVILMDLHMPD